MRVNTWYTIFKQYENFIGYDKQIIKTNRLFKLHNVPIMTSINQDPTNLRLELERGGRTPKITKAFTPSSQS